MRRIIPLLLFTAVLSCGALAQTGRDSVALTDGRVLRGYITGSNDDGSIILRLENGIVTEVPIDMVRSASGLGYRLPIAADMFDGHAGASLVPGTKSASTAALWALFIPAAGHMYAGNGERGLLFAAGEILAAVVAFNGIEKHTYEQIHTGGINLYPLLPINTEYRYTTTEVDYEFTPTFALGLALFGALKIWEMADASHQVTTSNQNVFETLQQTMSEHRIDVRLGASAGTRYELGVRIGL